VSKRVCLSGTSLEKNPGKKIQLLRFWVNTTLRQMYNIKFAQCHVFILHKAWLRKQNCHLCA